LLNVRQNGLGLEHDVFVPVPGYLPSLFRQTCVTLEVSRLIGMELAVDLDNEAGAQASEVDDEFIDGHLAPELAAQRSLA
jgi:hypothetical protein